MKLLFPTLFVIFSSQFKPRFLLISTLIFLSALFTACGGGGGSAPGEKGTGTIGGSVLYRNIDAHAGIFVSLEKQDNPDVLASQTQTDSNGSYNFDSVALGDYTLYVSSQTSLEKAIARTITLTETNALTVEDIFLTPVGAITGNVILDGKSNHIGISVYVPGTSYSAYTAGTGDYEISDVPVDTHALYASISGYMTTEIGSVTVIHGETVSANSITLIPLSPDIPDQPPAISSVTASPSVIQPGATSTLEVFAMDPEGDALTYLWSVAPGMGNLSATNTAVVIYTSPSAEGTYSIEVTVTANGKSVKSQVVVQAGYNLLSPPQISGVPPTSALQGQYYNFVPNVFDPNGGPFTFSIGNQPPWGIFDPAVGSLSGTPTNADIGIYYNILITVTDPDGLTANLPAFNIEVVNANDSPVISGTPATAVDVGSVYSFTATASDPDGDALSFSILNKPVWATFDTSTGTLTGVPNSDQVAPSPYSNIVISVSDGLLTASLPAFAIVVAAANAPPIISGTPATSVMINTPYSFTPSAYDPNLGDSIFFTITGQPSWAIFNAGTGMLSGVPAAGDLALYSNIVITVSDGTLTADLPAFSINVTRENSPPIANAGADQLVVAGETITLDGTASSDPDVIDTITYTWSQVAGTFVTLSNTSAAQPTFVAPGVPGDMVFSLIVSDGVFTSTADLVTITVSSDMIPTAAIDPTAYPILVEGGSRIFTSTASGGNGILSYSWDFPGGAPVSATVEDPGSVVFNTPGSYTITLTVTDVDGDADIRTLVVTVVNQKQPLIVSDRIDIFVMTPLSRREPIIIDKTDIFTTTPFSRREPYIISDTYPIEILP